MRFLKCAICDGEVDIIYSDKSINKKIKCRKCGFTNSTDIKERKEPEIIIIRKRSS